MKKEKNLRTFSLFLMLMFLSWGCQIDNGNNEGSNESKKVTLTYYANGVYGEKTETVDYGTGIIIAACPFSKEGYSFVKWSKEPETNDSTYYSSRYEINEKIYMYSDLKLYAIWKANTYTVEFDENAYDARGYVSNINATYDIEFKFSSFSSYSHYSRDGYRFTEWNTKADGSGRSYKIDNENVKNLTAENNGVVTLYAQWIEEDANSITYELNGGEHDGVPIKSFKVTEEVILGNAKKNGYTFNGWYTSERFYGNALLGWNPGEKKADVTLYAKWTKNTYTIKFDKNAYDATGDISDIHVDYDEKLDLSGKEFSRTGYDLGYWNTKADGSGKNCYTYSYYKDLTSDENTVLTLYAQWDAKRYNISYKYKEKSGYWSSFVGVGYYTIEDSVTLKDPLTMSEYNEYHMKGYTFNGWYENKDLTGDMITGWAPGQKTSSLELYAKRTANTYTVKFDCGEAGNVIADIHATYDIAFTMPKEPSPKSGYTFSWNTKADGSGTSYKASTDELYRETRNLTTENNGIVTLYAQWDKNYTIAYKNIENAETPSDNPEFYIAKDSVTLKAPTKTGYTFGGWYDTEGFSGSAITGWKPNEKAEDITLYAKWTANTYTVKIDKNASDATGTVDDIKVAYDEEFTIPESEFTRSEYKMFGWNTKADGSGTDYAAGTKIKNVTSANNATVTLYAQWLIPEKFIDIPGVSISGKESWTPSSSVFISGRKFKIAAFVMSDHEVTIAEYKSVMGEVPSSMASTNGNVNNNPVNNVSWYQAIVYCNKRSIKEGLTPCYTINSSTDPDDWGELPSSSYNEDEWENVTCDFTANGYRLPTEAEWEWAARGGDDETKYAGSDTASDVAWYRSSYSLYGTHEVKTKKANGYKLYDMSGNVNEWCWDRYTYSSSISTDTPATGASSGSYRSHRGGSYGESSYYCYVNEQRSTSPYSKSSYYGFRLVRTE